MIINALKITLISAFVLLALIAVAVNFKLPFGYKLLTVQSGSMEPAVPVGSILLTKPTSDFVSPLPSARFSEGDVVTYISTKEGSFVSHRVVEVVKQKSTFSYRTKGDSNYSPDSRLVAEEYIVGKMLLSAPYLGRIPDFIKQPLGYFLIIVVPALYVIGLEIISLWREIRKPRLDVHKSGANFALPAAMGVLACFYFVGGTAAFFSGTAISTNNVLAAANCFGEEGKVWAYEVVGSNQGLKKDGSSVDANRSDPNDILGVPDGSGSPVSGFFSLGFGGEVVVKFEHLIRNGQEEDISFHEITNGRSTYPEEKILVEVSETGEEETWEVVGVASSKDNLANGVSLLDFGSTGFEYIQYVRITDISNPAIHANNADGYDLDAVDAQYGCLLP